MSTTVSMDWPYASESIDIFYPDETESFYFPDEEDGAFWDNSLSFSIIPVIIVVVAIAVLIGLCIRHRRGHGGNMLSAPSDPERGNRTGANTGARRGGRTWAVWRHDDGLGLNEHGEAPPAYAVKALPGQSIAAGDPVRGDTTADLHSYEMDDMRRPSPGGHQRQGESSSSSSSSPPAAAPASPIAVPAQTHPAPSASEAPPPDYGAVTAGSTPPPPTAPHPSEISGNSNASPTTHAPLITTPPPAVSFWRQRGT